MKKNLLIAALFLFAVNFSVHGFVGKPGKSIIENQNVVSRTKAHVKLADSGFARLVVGASLVPVLPIFKLVGVSQKTVDVVSRAALSLKASSNPRSYGQANRPIAVVPRLHSKCVVHNFGAGDLLLNLVERTANDAVPVPLVASDKKKANAHGGDEQRIPSGDSQLETSVVGGKTHQNQFCLVGIALSTTERFERQ